MRTASLAVLAALAACHAEPQTNAAPPAGETSAARHPISGLPLVPLRVTADGRSHEFTVELARSTSEQSRGLMYRQALGASEGMLFPFASPRVAGFWMRNTYIPLDMIFIRADGTIARIAASTVPRSLDSVESGEPVVAVLEIAGGRSAELGIEAGDRVSWPGGPAA